jgi:arsenate reductase-like glutaredoxin family protein
MNFKVWFKLSETLDATTKGALERDTAPPTELAAFIKELEDKIEFLINKNEMAIQDMNRTTESRVEEFERVNKELEEKIKQLVTDKEILVWF